MTRKRIGTGLVEAFSENCEHCQGRGVVIQSTPVEPRNTDDDARRGGPGRRTRGGKGRGQDDSGPAVVPAHANGGASGRAIPSPKDIAAVARPENAEKAPIDEQASPDGAPAEAVAQVEEQPRSEQRSGRSRGRGRSRREPEAPVEEPQATESVVEEPQAEQEPAEPSRRGPGSEVQEPEARSRRSRRPRSRSP